MNTLKSLAVVVAIGLSLPAMAQTPSPGPGGPPRDPWGDATVTREESQAKAGEMFDGIDTNKDGTIREAEEDAITKSAGPRSRMILGALHRADANGDGRLTKAEFLAGQQERFDRQDTDHDGKLTKAERDAAREAMRQRMQRRGGGGFGPPTGE